MSFIALKNYRVPMIAAITAIVLVAYLPFWAHFLWIRGTQVTHNQHPGTILPIYGSDSIGYALLADNIVQEGVFSSSRAEPFTPDTFRTPGYPGMLAIFKWALGSHKFFPIVQIIFVILIALLIYKIGAEIFSETVGLLSALFFILDPSTLFHALVLLSEVPFTLFLLSSVYILFFSDSKLKYSANILAGLLLGFATLIRPISMFMPFIFLPAYLYINRGAHSKIIIKNIFLFLTAFVLVLAPWLLRNSRVAGVAGLSSVKDFNFFHYTMPEYLGYKRGVHPDNIRKIFYDELGAQGVLPIEAADISRYSAINEISHRYFKEDIMGYAKWHLVKMTPFFFSSGIKNFLYSYNDMLGYTVYGVDGANITNLLLAGRFGEFLTVLRGQFFITTEQLFWAGVFLLMFIPAFRPNKRIEVLILLAVVFYLALPTVPVAYARFRVPASPYMFLLAIGGLALIGDFIRNRYKRT